MRILIVGNSLVARNDLAAAVTSSAERMGLAGWRVGVVATDGRSIEDHLRDSDSRAAMESCDWDALIIQERSSLTSSWLLNGKVNYSYPHAYLEAVAEVVAATKKCDGDVYVMEAWTRSPAAYSYINHANSLLPMGTIAGVIPVGRYVMSLRDGVAPKLLSSDGLHPTIEGTRLAGDVIVMSLSGRPHDFCRLVSSSAACGAEVERVVSSPSPSPVYQPEPILQRLPSDKLPDSGKWISAAGGTRYSFGTQLLIDDNSEVAVVEFTPLARLVSRGESSLDGTALELDARLAGVDFHFWLNQREGILNALTRSGPSNRRVYRTALYSRDDSAAYFARLESLYSELEQADSAEAFASKAGHHYGELRRLVKEFGKVELAGLIEPDAWDYIIPAWHYSANQQLARAALYLDAARIAYPGSFDVAAESMRYYTRQGEVAQSRGVLEEYISGGRFSSEQIKALERLAIN